MNLPVITTHALRLPWSAAATYSFKDSVFLGPNLRSIQAALEAVLMPHSAHQEHWLQLRITLQVHAHWASHPSTMNIPWSTSKLPGMPKLSQTYKP